MSTGGASLENQFLAFSRFGDSKSDGKTITLSNTDKWMKQAHVIDGKTITTTDTGIAFNKFKSKNIDLVTFRKFVEDLANQKKIAPDELFHKLASCGPPGTSQTTKTTHVGGVDHLTDTSKYTGTHKERFDESGHGKGIAGRSDVAENTGYVQGFKGKEADKKQYR